MKRHGDVAFWFIIAILFGLGGMLAAQQSVTLGTCANGEVRVTTPGGLVTCVSGTAPPTNTAVLTNATATPATITAGQASTLNWTSTGGDPASIVVNPGGLKPAVTARSQQVKPTMTTVYTVTYNMGTPQATNRSVTVTVSTTTPGAPTFSGPPSATPATVTAGASSTLNWVITGTPTFQSLEPGYGTIPATARTYTVNPKTTTTYLITIGAGGNTTGQATVTVTVGTAPPTGQDCIGAWGPWVQGPWTACTGDPGSRSRVDTRSFLMTTSPIPPGAACPASPESNTVTEPCTVTPVPPVTGIWGVVDPDILGGCTAAVHDVHVIQDPADGQRYRSWHPQRDPTGCWYAHEHGDNPQPFIDAEVQHLKSINAPASMIAFYQRPVMYGWIGRHHSMPNEPNGHEEPHEGFKTFGALPGMRNDEQRTNRVWSLSTFHMGTQRPGRFSTVPHSADIRLITPEGPATATRLMMDTGGTGIVCDPRTSGNTKDVININFVSMCGGKKMGSLYEIWRTSQTIRDAARGTIALIFANPAVFDPLAALNPAAPTELVQIGTTTGKSDPRVEALKQFPENPWHEGRGCIRESYAQPGYFYNDGGPTLYHTDANGQVVPSTDPRAIPQYISAHSRLDFNATGGGNPENTPNGAFKQKVDWCRGIQYGDGESARLGIPAGSLDKARLGLKN